MIKHRFIHHLSYILLAMCTFSMACVEAPPYFYAEKITGRNFEIFDDAIGVYPSTVVLQDPQNPFARYAPGMETKWEIEANGDPIAGFYSGLHC